MNLATLVIWEELLLYIAASKSIVSIALTREHKGIHISIYYVSKALVDSRTMHSPLEKLIFILVIAI